MNNKNNLRGLFGSCALASIDKQRHLNLLLGESAWHFDLITGFLSFADRYRWNAQILGTEADENKNLALVLG